MPNLPIDIKFETHKRGENEYLLSITPIGEIENIERKEKEYIYTIEFDEQFKKYVVTKGSIGINGVSLTIGEIENNRIKVHIIPYTYENTNFKNLKKGDAVNIEFDIIGKYIIAAIEKQNKNNLT